MTLSKPPDYQLISLAGKTQVLKGLNDTTTLTAGHSNKRK